MILSLLLGRGSSIIGRCVLIAQTRQRLIDDKEGKEKKENQLVTPPFIFNCKYAFPIPISRFNVRDISLVALRTILLYTSE